jgi:SAM-dependent methyltransferase
MTTVSRDNNGDLAFLEKNAARIREEGLHLPHLDQTVNLLNYLRIADDIATKVAAFRGSIKRTQLLDWGCGYGQMSWLLRRRGFHIVSFDIGPDETRLPNIPLCEGLEVVRTVHPTDLPLTDRSFGAVLSCGVLEHVDECSGVVGNERKSLAEIARVLEPNGLLLIYQLPQKAAWQEALVRKLKLGYSHPRRYTAKEIKEILERAQFSVVSINRSNLIPKNLTGLPVAFRTAYSRFSRPLMWIDSMLCRIPLLNRIAGVLEILAVKRDVGQA